MIANAFTVAELIEKLATYPQDLPVMLPGYEGGYNHSLTLQQKTVQLFVLEEDYYGNHEEEGCFKQEQQDKKTDALDALVIEGTRDAGGQQL